MNIENAYKELAKYAIFKASSYEWNKIFLEIEIYEQSCAVTHWIYNNDLKFQSKNIVPIEIDFAVTKAAIEIRSDLLKSTGGRIWGIKFTLQNDEKFTIEYSYDKPEGYDE